MAGPDIPKIGEEISRETERTTREVNDKKGAVEALEFAQALGEMQVALGKIAKALNRANFKNNRDYEKANDVFGEKLADALRAFQKMNELGARDLAVEETRGALNQLGVLAERGPASYPKPSFGMGFFKPSQVELWLNDVKTNPARVAAEMANAADGARSEAQVADAANPMEQRGRALTGEELARLDNATHGTFGINTGDEPQANP